MKRLILSCILFVMFGLHAHAQKDTTIKDPYVSNITIEVSEINDALLFASSIDIVFKASSGAEKFASQTLFGSLEIGEQRTMQMDLLNKKVPKSTFFNSKLAFLFNSRSSDDFIGLFNFIFDFSDGTTYTYRFGKLTIGNDLKLPSITRSVYIH
jgi:hypothetical protein